jgi:YD repeat-containing protein
MSAIETGNAATRATAPGETSAVAAPSPQDDGTRLSNERPFPGLRPFGFADRGFFFGRERQAFALYRLVENARFTAVIGSSGSGKSSLVLAGLQALLADETADSGGPTWAFLDMRPGGAPIKRLAGALAKLSAKDTPDEAARRRDRTEWRLRQSSFSFEAALDEAGGLGARTLILVVDQFEELFRFGLAGLGRRGAGVEEARQRDEAAQFVQILLDADRRRIENVRVLITMRSDFIGDCAYFHGLPEAVSATQYLVPNLTRSQLEEAIRKPIEKADGTIEPELVERLINDCGDELDQLPVLQHCLMRLWDRAGAAATDKSARHVTRQTYDEIGRMSEALSRHADETLAECAGKELAVEQAFRALSELDQEGRAIRRARRFSKLLAETGSSESDLRDILDKFRAPSCSFLVPPLSAPLRDDDIVDIGHEALLRCWRRLAGDPLAKTGDGGAQPPANGWLSAEDQDGRRYRVLVSMLGHGDEPSETLQRAKETAQWWAERPRTPAWAQRYGGEFERVKALIEDSLAAKRRARLTIGAAVAVAVLLALGLGAYIVKLRADEARTQAEAQAKADYEIADSARSLLSEIYSDSSGVSTAAARVLATGSDKFLQELSSRHNAGDAGIPIADAKITVSDFYVRGGDWPDALRLAQEAENSARSFVAGRPNDAHIHQQIYDAAVRAGAAFTAGRPAGLDSATKEFQSALAEAETLNQIRPDESSKNDLVDADMKLGDLERDRHNVSAALGEYQAGLSACEAALRDAPDSALLRRDRAKAHYRVADLFLSEKRFDEAEREFALAETDQKALIESNPTDLSLKSNLAATYARWGLVDRDRNDLDGALSNLKSAVALQETLVANNPGDLSWKEFLAPNYAAIADILERQKLLDQSLLYLKKAFETRVDFAKPSARNLRFMMDFAASAKRVGDSSAGSTRLSAYQQAAQIWELLALGPAAGDAAGHYDDVAKFAEAFEGEQDWQGALKIWTMAQTLAQLNLKASPSDDRWRQAAETSAKHAADAAGRLASAPAPETRSP